MSHSIPPTARCSKGRTAALDSNPEDKSLVLGDPRQNNSPVLGGAAEDDGLVRRLLRDAITESKLKDGAVAEAIGLKGESGAAYLSKMLAGEKPIGAKHLRALPEPVGAIFARMYAESYGLIVVSPADNVEQAMRFVVRGLLGLFRDNEPIEIRMAKATFHGRVGAAERQRA